MTNKEFRYLRLDHASADDVRLSGRWAAAFGVIIIAFVFMLGVAVGERIGYSNGKTAATNDMHAVIDESIKRGGWFGFEGGRVMLISVVRTDSGGFRRMARDRAERYDLVRYRAIQAYGPEDDDKGFDVRF